MGYHDYFLLIGTLFSSLSLGIRRMHDTDRSGWWQLVPIIGLVYSIEAGQTGVNKYGPDPKGRGV